MPQAVWWLDSSTEGAQKLVRVQPWYKGKGRYRARAKCRTPGQSAGGTPKPALQDQGRLPARRDFLLSQDLSDKQALVTGRRAGETEGKGKHGWFGYVSAVRTAGTRGAAGVGEADARAGWGGGMGKGLSHEVSLSQGEDCGLYPEGSRLALKGFNTSP